MILKFYQAEPLRYKFSLVMRNKFHLSQIFQKLRVRSPKNKSKPPDQLPSISNVLNKHIEHQMQTINFINHVNKHEIFANDPYSFESKPTT